MATAERQTSWRGVLRPLVWWLLLVLILFAVHTHERLLEQTRLYFSLSLDGHPLPYPVNVTFDGKPIRSGDKIPLFDHHFEITGNQTDPVAMDLSVWYGRHDLGDIHLKRSTGTLSVSATPAAQLITISGAEFSTNFAGCSNTVMTVPTGSYTVGAQYRHWDDSRTLEVMRDLSASATFVPRFGALNITCNQDGATFQLQNANGNTIENGNLPVTLTEIPAGYYQIVASHHSHQLQKSVTVNNDVTNDVLIDFEYGATVIESVPSGASVYGSDNSYWGQTPLQLSEVTPQTLHFQIEMNGYQSVPATLIVVANETNALQTNLVSFNYLNAMQDAHNFMAQTNYEQAAVAVNHAIEVRPDDTDATALRQKIRVLSDIQSAEKWGGQGNYVQAVKVLNDALMVEPDNEQAKTMLAFDTQRVPEQIERQRLKRLNLPHKVFNDTLSHYPDAGLFEEHELTTGKPFDTVGGAIALALKSSPPYFQLTEISRPTAETYEIAATQNVGGILINGQRVCVIVCGQAKDDETQIWLKVLEFKKHISFSLQGGLTEHDEEIPINSSRIQMTDALQAQLTNGVQIVTERIKQAITQ